MPQPTKKCQCGGKLYTEPNADNPDFQICENCGQPYYKGKIIKESYF